MKYKVAELEGALLDAAVAKADGTGIHWHERGECWFKDADGLLYHPSKAWSQGGPIIERERIALHVTFQDKDQCPEQGWWASVDRFLTTQQYGQTPLIAAMRAYVASKFGEEVDLG